MQRVVRHADVRAAGDGPPCDERPRARHGAHQRHREDRGDAVRLEDRGGEVPGAGGARVGVARPLGGVDGGDFGGERGEGGRGVQEVPEQEGGGGGGRVRAGDEEAEGFGLDVGQVERATAVLVEELAEEVAPGGVGAGEAGLHAGDGELLGEGVGKC